MLVRTIGTLKATQARILESYKQERNAAVALVDDLTGAAVSRFAFGRVDEIVTSDEQFGPHLKVALQQFGGTPPTPTDANGATQVYYPAPGGWVGDYAIDEWVRLEFASGVRFAIKL